MLDYEVSLKQNYKFFLNDIPRTIFIPCIVVGLYKCTINGHKVTHRFRTRICGSHNKLIRVGFEHTVGSARQQLKLEQYQCNLLLLINNF